MAVIVLLFTTIFLFFFSNESIQNLPKTSTVHIAPINCIIRPYQYLFDTFSDQIEVCIAIIFLLILYLITVLLTKKINYD